MISGPYHIEIVRKPDGWWVHELMGINETYYGPYRWRWLASIDMFFFIRED